VGSVAGGCTFERPYEGVGGAVCPEVIEFGGIPDGFEGYLRHAYGVGRGTLGGVGEALRRNCIVHVGLVVRAVKVLAVPASTSSQYYTVSRWRGIQRFNTDAGKW